MPPESEHIMYDQPDRVDARLALLGLDRERLVQAVRTGEAERATCTANDPRILRGLLPWGRALRALRELYSPNEGWVRDDPSGLPLLVHHDRNIALTVETGDERTGRAGPPSRTKHKKGPALEEYVVGFRQLSLLSDDVEELPHIWILLVHRDRAGDVRAELSRPTSQSAVDGRVTFAGERIFLGSIPAPGQPILDEDDDEGEDGWDVAVERR